MSNYKDFSKLHYPEIKEDEIKNGDVFICKTKADKNLFSVWSLAVIKRDNDCMHILGLFRTTEHARIFAGAIKPQPNGNQNENSKNSNE